MLIQYAEGLAGEWEELKVVIAGRAGSNWEISQDWVCAYYNPNKMFTKHDPRNFSSWPPCRKRRASWSRLRSAPTKLSATRCYSWSTSASTFPKKFARWKRSTRVRWPGRLSKNGARTRTKTWPSWPRPRIRNCGDLGATGRLALRFAATKPDTGNVLMKTMTVPISRRTALKLSRVPVSSPWFLQKYRRK